MRRTIFLFLSLMLFVLPISITASAAEAEMTVVSSSTEYLENGDYIVTTVCKNAIQPRSGTSGSKASTYYNSAGEKIFAVTVTGTFTYVYGSSVSATGASALVGVNHPDAQFISKNAYTSFHNAIGVGNVKYQGRPLSLTVTLSCDVYGGLH